MRTTEADFPLLERKTALITCVSGPWQADSGPIWGRTDRLDGLSGARVGPGERQQTKGRAGEVATPRPALGGWTSFRRIRGETRPTPSTGRRSVEFLSYTARN